MRLYYIFESCALASHIVANEAGIPIEPIQVDRRTKKTTTGADFLAINPKGYVPMLELDNGEVLTENASLQHLAELKPESRLAPPNGTFACVRLQEALNYIATEILRGYGPLFNPSTPTAAREEHSVNLRNGYALLDKQLAGRKYLLGEDFRGADAYLFTLTRWAAAVKLDLSDFANLRESMKSVAARSAVQTAMKGQGLIPV